MGGVIEAYREVARRLGILQDQNANVTEIGSGKSKKTGPKSIEGGKA
jgi:hypothetical protein